ncbi:hypothetical protein [Flavobacterium sp. GNP001]
MTKKFFLSFLLTTALSCYGQKKTNTYLDFNMNIIDKDSFSVMDKNPKYISLRYDADSTYFNVIFKRKTSNKLSKEKLNDLKEYLQNITATKIDENAIILINYLSKNPKIKDTVNITEWNIFHRHYLKKIKKKNNIFQVWINHPDQKNLVYYQGNKVNWIVDKTKFIENLFFPYDFLHGSFVVVNFDGHFISYFGEYGKQEVIDLLDELKK